MSTGISANRLEILQIADSVAREKSIDKEIVIQAMEHALQKAARSRYGAEHDIRATIDPKTGLPAEKGITEAFKPDQDPEAPPVPGALGGSSGSAQRSVPVPVPVPAAPGAGASSSGGGIY